MEYAIDTMKTILLEHKVPGEEIKLIVSRDGLHLASSGLDDEEKDTFSAMCATMYGAGETAFFATGRESVKYIGIYSKESHLYIVEAGEHALVTVVVTSSQSSDKVLSAILVIAKDVSKLDLS